MYKQLFSSFFRIGLCSFGGGYAMLPLLQREIIDKRGWATQEELADYYAVGQCTPGIIMVNTATFIGYKQRGVLGGIVATLSAVLAPFCIILAVAALLGNFADLPVVKNAFAGVRVCVAVLIFRAVAKLYKNAVPDRWAFGLFLIVLLLGVLTSVSPVLLVLAAGLAGVVLKVWRQAAK